MSPCLDPHVAKDLYSGKGSAMPRIRMLTPRDWAALSALPTRVSSDTLYARFHGVVRVPTTPTLSRLLDLERGRHEAVIAETDEGIVAVARCVRDTPTPVEAEVAIVVADAWQRAGVGRTIRPRPMRQRADEASISVRMWLSVRFRSCPPAEWTPRRARPMVSISR
jgi:hypothetical protein